MQQHGGANRLAFLLEPSPVGELQWRVTDPAESHAARQSAPVRDCMGGCGTACRNRTVTVKAARPAALGVSCVPTSTLAAQRMSLWLGPLCDLSVQLRWSLARRAVTRPVGKATGAV